MTIQRAFQPAIEHALELCKRRFRTRLDAVYVGGSVAVGEAWPGESDVDWFMFLTEMPNQSDQSWCKKTEEELVSRKIIRNFILLEGAYVLMLTDDFKSFRQDDVLPRLATLYPRWRPLIHMASDVLNDPLAAGVPPQKVLEATVPFAMWAIERTEKKEQNA